MAVLIVDDSKAMRMIVRRTLKQAGFDNDVEEADDGDVALEKIRGSRYEFVLSDWNMPNMTGIDLLKAIKDENHPVKFGFVTSEVTPEMRQAAEDAGALFLIGKPFTDADFERHLSEHL